MKILHRMSNFLIFLALPLAAFVGVALFAGVATADDYDEDDEDRIWSTESDVRVQIELISGDIEIVGWDRNEVRVRVNGDEASALEVKASRKRIRIKGPNIRRRRGFWNAGNFDIDIHVTVPIGSRIQVKTTSGAIQVKGVDGTLDLRSGNGEIDVQGNPTEARLETINAGIEFEGKDSDVDARTVNGSIDLRGVAGEVFATAISGSIQVEAGVVDRVELKTLSGSIDLSARFSQDVRAHLKTFNGSIQLELPSDTSARFDIESFSGGIQNELSATSTNTGGGRGRRLEFTTGDGDGRVTIESFSGSIEIREKD